MGRVSRVVVLVAVFAGHASSLDLAGLPQPVHFSVHSASGRVYVACKRGLIYVAANTSSTSATLAANLTALVFSGGDLGLTSVAADDAFLYATLSVPSSLAAAASPGVCTDTGAPGNRSALNVTGCAAAGALVRFAVGAGGELSAPAWLVPGGGLAPGARAGPAQSPWCAQFGRNGISHALLTPPAPAAGPPPSSSASSSPSSSASSPSSAPPRALIVAAGVGANDNAVDVGAFAGDACGAAAAGAGAPPAPPGPPGPPGAGGAFRAQDGGATYGGKIVSIPTALFDGLSASPAPPWLAAPGAGAGNVSVVAQGFRNPWRMAFNATSLAAAGAGPAPPAGAAPSPSSSSAAAAAAAAAAGGANASSPACAPASGDGALWTVENNGGGYDSVVGPLPLGGAAGGAPPPALNNGFPCVAPDGSAPAGYAGLCSAPPPAGWGAPGAPPGVAPPALVYAHAGAPGTLSALAVHPLTGRVWLADYANARVLSATRDGAGGLAVEVAGGVYAAHLAFLVPPGAAGLGEGAMHYADVVTGRVRALPASPGAPPPLPPGACAPAAPAAPAAASGRGARARPGAAAALAAGAAAAALAAAAGAARQSW